MQAINGSVHLVRERYDVTTAPVASVARPRQARRTVRTPITESQRVLQLLQDKITSGEWPLGAKIPVESVLTQEFAVSRSTLREAISTLVHLGMLEPHRSQGTFVRQRSAIPSAFAEFTRHHDLDDVRWTQRAIEVEASRGAALHRTEEDLDRLRQAHLGGAHRDCRQHPSGSFHALIAKASGNALLVELQVGLDLRLRELDEQRVPLHPAVDHRHGEDHRMLLEAITARDPERAALIAAAHARARPVLGADRDARRVSS